MVTLKELVEYQLFTDISDIEIIKMYFDKNDIEEDGIDLIRDLTTSKIKKLKQKHSLSEMWATCFPSTYLYETYDLNTADNLHKLELDYLINGGELSKEWLKWAKENLPNIDRPQCYFNPLVDHMRDLGIQFKGDEK